MKKFIYMGLIGLALILSAAGMPFEAIAAGSAEMQDFGLSAVALAGIPMIPIGGMIFDMQNLLSDDQAITATDVSDNVIDLGAVGTPIGAAAALVRNLGKGLPIEFLIQVTDALLAAGAATLVVTLETDDNEAFASAVVVWTSPVIPKATLVAGYQFDPIQYIPQGVNERYFRLNYTVATGPFTAGTITAGITMGNQSNF